MNSSPVRFTGLTSGMDTQSMVQQMMRAESMRMERLTRRRTLVQWRQEGLRNTMTMMNEFRRTHTDANLGTRSINSPAVWNTVSASVTNTNGSGSTVGISVTSTSNARVGSFNVRVEQAASGDVAMGAEFTNRGGTGTPVRLNPGEVRVGGVDLNTRISHFINMGVTFLPDDATFPSGRTYLQINGQNIGISDNYTVQQVMDAVNRNANAGVNMRFDEIRGRFILEATATGANATVSTGSDTEGWGVLELMGLHNLRAPGTAATDPRLTTGGTHVGGAQLTRDNFLNTALSDLSTSNIPTGTNPMTIGGTTVAINVTADMTVQGLLNAVNAALSSTDFTISFNSAGRFEITAANNAVITTGTSGGFVDNYVLEFMGLAGLTAEATNRAYSQGITTAVISELEGANPEDITLDALFGSAEVPTRFFHLHVNGAFVGSPINLAETTLQDFIDMLEAEGLSVTINASNSMTITNTDPNNTVFPSISIEGTISNPPPPDDELAAENALSSAQAAALTNALGLSTATAQINSLNAANVRHTATSVNADIFNLSNSVAATVDFTTNYAGTITNAAGGTIRYHLVQIGESPVPGVIPQQMAPAFIQMRETDTFQSFMERVNNSHVGVYMAFDAATGTFSLTPTGEGDNARIITGEARPGDPSADPPVPAVTPDQSGILAFLGLNAIDFSAARDADSDDRLVQRAQNAVIYYDYGPGGFPPARIEQSHNTFNMHGLNISITNAVESGSVFTINAERDVESTMEAIMEFVEAYNNLIRYLNALHTTPRPRHGNTTRGAFFEPLTDEQRQAMSDREIERWEEQARIGLLHRDRDIRSIHQQIRTAMFSPVVLARDENGRPTDQIALFNIGITTVGRDGAPGDQLIGVMQIDEERLRAELEADPERVRALFASNGSAFNDGHPMPWGTMEQRNARSEVVGLGFRLDDVLNNVAQDNRSSLQERAGYHTGMNSTENVMTRQLRDYDRRIDTMQQWLLRRENHFFSMFARMEQAMAQSHAQMDALFAWGAQ
ncbi:MAG: flagellar filament capping protein FliD [Defluviitaleaceae bacterium]|nr:flagellar filament capping protein FliD [Defluviitaleaceae bacterium]